MPTLTLLRSPASVMAPGVEATSSSSAAPTSTSSRWRSTWLGRPPRTLSNSAIAVCTTSGCATQVPSKPEPASRFLSAATASIARSLASGSLRDGISAAMPPIACAPRRWHVLTSSSL